MDFKKNIVLRNHTAFRIGGKAKFFFLAKNKNEIIRAVLWAKRKSLPFFVLGKGSNVLISDKGFWGVVIKIENSEFKIQDLELEVGAGLDLGKLIGISLKNNLSGLEWAAGIPGTVGGALAGNAGAFGKSMKNIVKEAEVFDAKEEKIRVLKNKECKFSYRKSIFKKNRNLIILSVKIKLKKGIRKKSEEINKIYLKKRKDSQPLEYSSAGSVFKNPKGYSAGQLIEKCGLKGRTIGGAKISEKHANFIVNFKNAKSVDVEKLIMLAKKEVKDKFKISLEEEIEIF